MADYNGQAYDGLATTIPVVSETYSIEVRVRLNTDDLDRRELEDSEEFNCKDDFLMLEEPFVAD